jgi:hypothetical protein
MADGTLAGASGKKRSEIPVGPRDRGRATPEPLDRRIALRRGTL